MAGQILARGRRDVQGELLHERPHIAMRRLQSSVERAQGERRTGLPDEMSGVRRAKNGKNRLSIVKCVSKTNLIEKRLERWSKERLNVLRVLMFGVSNLVQKAGVMDMKLHARNVEECPNRK